MQDPGDDERRGVQEFQMGFEHDVGFGRTGCCVPEDWVVVGEEGEEDTEAETGCWFVDLVRGNEWKGSK